MNPTALPAPTPPRLRLTLAQINPTVGDIAGNVARMRSAARQARDQGSDLVVFPELALCGYWPGDLLRDADFLHQLDAGLHSLLQASRECPALVWVLGAPLRRPVGSPGKALYNGLLVLRNGHILLTQAKQLLPTYDVFDEHRHFEPGPDRCPVLSLGALRLGFLICEDGWNDAAQQYAINPWQRLADAAPDAVIAINASPSHRGKQAQRRRVLAQACQRHRLPLLWVNQVGGQDQVVYDGASMAFAASGELLYQAPAFAEVVHTLGLADGFTTADGQPLPPPPPPLPVLALYREHIVLGLRDYVRRCGFQQVVVGCSGGIDSALTLALAVQALGPQQVVALTLPSRWSSAGSVDDSVDLCQRLGVVLHTLPIEPLVGATVQALQAALGSAPSGLTQENLQARLRGLLLMAVSNHAGPLLLSTGNKSELSVGYCTLYGDTNGGLGLLGDLYKTEVFALARYLNDCARAVGQTEPIPQAILDKPPSAELAPGQQDSDSLPPYPVLDAILQSQLEEPDEDDAQSQAAQACVRQLRQQADGRALLTRVLGGLARSEYKRRQAPPVIRLRPRAFGSGRQMPLASPWVPGLGDTSSLSTPTPMPASA